MTSVWAVKAQGLRLLHDAAQASEHPDLVEAFEAHATATESHQNRVGERLADYGIETAMTGAKDGLPTELFAASSADTAERAVARAFAFEHLEIAVHALLARLARRLRDGPTLAMAEEIAAEEREMASRLAAAFDLVVDPSPLPASGEEIRAELMRHLTTAHATEREGLHLLESGLQVIKDPDLRQLFERHLRESEEHERAIRERLEVHAGEPGRAEDAVLPISGMQVGALSAAGPDASGRLLALVYPYMHLEIAVHELLARAARRAGDGKVLAQTARILDEERAFADELAARWLRDDDELTDGWLQDAAIS